MNETPRAAGRVPAPGRREPGGLEVAADAALLVIDVQQGFDRADFWGRRDNPAAERHIEALLDAWQRTGRPVVFVRHDSVTEGSPLRPGEPGNALRDFVAARQGTGTGPELLVTKSVNSAFYGTPDLHAWLTAAGIRQLVATGVQTNMCVETTTRMGGNLGYDMLFALDATHTFDHGGLTAEELARATAANLHGEFARVVGTAELLAAVAAPGAAQHP